MTQDARTKANALEVAGYTLPSSLGAHPTVYPWITATGDYDFPTATRAIRAATSGNVTYKDANNVNKVAAFLAGETRMLIALSIVGAGTTVTALEGMP